MTAAQKSHACPNYAVQGTDEQCAAGWSGYGDRSRYVAARDAYKDCEARARAVLGCGL